MPGTTMPGTTMPGTTMPGTTMPGTIPTQPRTMPTTPGGPSTFPGGPRIGMPPQPTPQTPFSPGTNPPTRTQEYYYSVQNNDRMNQRYMDEDYMDENEDYDDDNDDMMMPGMYMNPSLPMGIPLMPLYGYDNCEDADKDWDYMRQMYPMVAKKILVEIDEECDKLEYDGSCMFDEYPDRVYLGRIADRIYNKVKYLEDDDAFVSPESLEESEKSNVEVNQYSQFYRDDRRNRRDNRNRRFNLRDLIEVLLFHEILNRRRRYRSRRRWF